MRIRVDNIPEGGRQIAEEIDPSAIELDVPGYGATEAFAFTGRATRLGEDVTLEGSLTGSVDSRCSRCLNDFRMPVDMSIDLVFVPRIEPARDDAEAVDVDIDAGFSYYDGNSIDLLRELRELVLVNLPIKPVCREDCKGLCPRCGADLNDAPCRCAGEKGPSPFDKLKGLKAKLEKQ